MSSSIEASKTTFDIKMHDYLDADILFYIFQFLIKTNPYQMMRCARVCIFWRNLTDENNLWRQFAKRLHIKEDQEPSLKRAIAKVISEARIAVGMADAQDLIHFEEKREFVFNALNARILRLPQGHAKTELQITLAEMRRDKIERLNLLKAAFFGHLSLSAVGLSNLSKAQVIAGILASDRYLEKQPLKDYNDCRGLSCTI